MGRIGADELDSLIAYVRDRYARSEQPPDVVLALNRHNDRVLKHVEEIAEGEGLDEEETELLKTIAILHDAAKADTHLLLHADAGSEVAGEKLRELAKDEAFIQLVQQSIRCHMGPFPFIDEEARKYAERTGDHLHLPRPETKVDQLFYDADMLALIDVDGIEKVVVLRQTTPEFMEEDEQTAKSDGGTPRDAAYRSALQSVQRAADTLFSATARKIASRLVAEAKEHVAKNLSSA